MASAFKRKEDKGKKGTVYIGSWYDAETERWRQFKGHTDSALTLAKAERLERESALRREGFSSSERDESIKPIDDQLKQYIATVTGKERDENYVRNCLASIPPEWAVRSGAGFAVGG